MVNKISQSITRVLFRSMWRVWAEKIWERCMREVSNGHQNQSIKRVFCSIAGIPNHLVNQFNIFPPINILVIRNTNTLKGTWSRRESGARVSLDQRLGLWNFRATWSWEGSHEHLYRRGLQAVCWRPGERSLAGCRISRQVWSQECFGELRSGWLSHLARSPWRWDTRAWLRGCFSP